MDFQQLKEKVKKEVAIQETDFIEENDSTLNVGFLETTATQKLVYSISNYRDKKFFDIRTWYQEESGQWKPTKKGIHLSFDRIEEIEKAIALFKQIIALDK